jgi:hypothetical protein
VIEISQKSGKAPTFQIRITPRTERRNLEAAAEAQGMSLGNWAQDFRTQ